MASAALHRRGLPLCPSEEFSALHYLCIRSRLTLPQKSLFRYSRWYTRAAQTVFLVAHPAAKMFFKPESRVSQGWAFWVEGPVLGASVTLPTRCSVASSSNPCQQPGPGIWLFPGAAAGSTFSGTLSSPLAPFG